METTEDDLHALVSWKETLNRLLAALDCPVSKNFEEGFSTEGVASMFTPGDANGLLGRIEKTVQEGLQEPSPEQSAWDTLTRLEESVRALENRSYEKEFASLYATRSAILFTAYEEAPRFRFGGAVF